MNTRTMKAGQYEFEDNPAAHQSPGILAILAAIPAQFRNARTIEKQAKRLYAMNDAALDEIGLSRDAIPAQLLKSYE